MAKFWEDLQYHEDTVEKRPITRDEVQFLIDLQKEMNTQDHVGQADPRYWVIRDYEKIYGKELNNFDGFCVYDSTNCETVCEIEYKMFGSSDMAEQVLKELEEQEYELSEEEKESITNTWDMDSLIEALEELDFTCSQYEIVPKYSGFFLTQKAAEDHLRENHYHYEDNATTFAMTAWRSKEADMLYKILHEVDFSKLESEG